MTDKLGPTEMISFGAGVNSAAMTIMLVEQGWHGPIVMADPGAEHPETYCWMTYFEKEYLKPRGLEIIRILPGSPYHKRSDLPLYEFCLECGIVPYLASRWCSVEWKVTPLSNWAAEHGITTRFIGYASDEMHRAKDYEGRVYPLIDAGITRKGCLSIIAQAGLEAPVKSGCFFCPGMRLSGWKKLYFDYPDLYERAVALEKNATARHGKLITLDPHGISLRQHAERRWQGQMQMDLSQWLPCACRL